MFIFKKNKNDKLKKVEFHVHTCYSKDSILTFPFILLMCKLKKINCIAITDHNEITGAILYKEKLKKYGVEVIVGEEIFSKDGEIIGLYLKEKIPENLSASETVALIKKQNGIVYIPHPYDEKRKKTVLTLDALKEIVDEVDLMESYNGRNIKKYYQQKQKHIVRENNLVGVVGSDAHTFYELGRNYCLLKSTNKDEIVKSINDGLFFTKSCIKYAHFNTKIAKVIQLVKRRDINGLCRIINNKCKGKM